MSHLSEANLIDARLRTLEWNSDRLRVEVNVVSGDLGPYAYYNVQKFFTL